MTPIYGAINVDMQEVGDDVVISYSGSWDVWNNSDNAFSSNNASGIESDRLLQTGTENYRQYLENSFELTAGSWSTDNSLDVSADEVSGDAFGFIFDIDYIAAPSNYNQGEPIAGSMTFNDTNISDLGFTPGQTATFSGGGNTVNFEVIPEPSSYGFLLSAVGLATAIVARRRRTEAA